MPPALWFNRRISNLILLRGGNLASGLTQVLSQSGAQLPGSPITYLYGNGRIAQSSIVNQQSQMEYFLGDALGSVRQMTDSSGAVTLAKNYDPYGQAAQSLGAASSSYGYTGEYQTGGMVYLRARMYAPSMGRFLTRDTWDGDANRPMSFNRWNYVEANPVNFADPTGHMSASGQGINERDLTYWLSREMTVNANSSYVHKIKALMNSNDLATMKRGLDAFGNLVQDRAKWDFKHKIKVEMQEMIVLFDNNHDGLGNTGGSGWWYEYSVPGNIHFGFIGRAAGIPGWLLHLGAGEAEVFDPFHLERDIFGVKIKINPPFCPAGAAGEACRKYSCPYIDPAWIPTWFDEPKDYNAVEAGIQLFDLYGANISYAQLMQGLTSRGQSLDHSGVKPAWAWSNPRGGWPYTVGRFNGSREAEYEPIIQGLLK